MTPKHSAPTAPAPFPTPEPGIYPDIPFADYLRWNAMSNSQLGILARSPAHLKAYLDDPQDKDSDAFAYGRAVHTLVLEPEKFDGAYIREPTLGDSGNPRATKEYKVAKAELKKEHPDATILRHSDWLEVHEVARSVLAHSGAKAMLTGEGRMELSLVWDCPDTGVRCKARLDRLSMDMPGGAVVDLKSARSAEYYDMRNAIYKFGYFRKGAHYVRGCTALGLPVKHFVIVAVEKERPFLVAAYRITEDVLDAGADEAIRLLTLYKKCRDSDTWPGYPRVIQDIGIPSWAWKLLEPIQS